jgi:SnoaL-like domain
MFDAPALADSYIEMWNESDAERRRAIAADILSEDAAYLDPMMSGDGIDGISEMIAGAQAQFPGHRVTLISGPEAHHDRLRFSWSLAANGGEPVARGTDYVTVAEDGRMRSVTGFLDVS